MKPVIYKIEFPNGAFYIGATCNFPSRRHAHMRSFRKGCAVNTKLQSAYNAHQACKIYQLASGFSRETLHELEQAVIDQEQPCLNISKPVPLPAPGDGKLKAFGPYMSIAEFARANGLTYRQAKYLSKITTYPEWLANLEKTKIKSKPCKYPPNPYKNGRYFFENNTWYDGVQLRELHQVPKDRYKRRLKEGYSRLDACTLPPMATCEKSELTILAEKSGLLPAVVKSRIKYGWPVDVAISLPSGSKYKDPKVRKRIITIGEKSQPLDTWAKEQGIKSSIVHARLHLGWTEAQAVGLELPPNHAKHEQAKVRRKLKEERRAKNQHTYGGFTGSLLALCRHLAIEDRYATIAGRIKRGWTVAEAIESPVQSRLLRR